MLYKSPKRIITLFIAKTLIVLFFKAKINKSNVIRPMLVYKRNLDEIILFIKEK